jgi:uncharacterized protein
MIELQQHIAQIKTLCDEHNVKGLFAFGSITNNTLNEDSDIDLLVDIDDNDPLAYSEHYFDLKFQLEDIFNRPVDLLENKALKNSYLKKQIDDTKVLVYAR